jgi:DNA-binding transcriptional LysR family regulator
MAACDKAGFRPHIVQRARHSETLVGLVRSGAGIALVSSSVRTRGGSGVVFKKIIGPLPMAEIAVAWRRSDSSPLLHAFLDTVRSARQEDARPGQRRPRNR